MFLIDAVIHSPVLESSCPVESGQNPRRGRLLITRINLALPINNECLLWIEKSLLNPIDRHVEILHINAHVVLQHFAVILVVLSAVSFQVVTLCLQLRNTYLLVVA